MNEKIILIFLLLKQQLFITLSDYNLQKKNRTVSSSAGTLSEELALVSKKSGEYKPVTVYTDPLTGKRVAPDVGWSHNPASGLIEGN